MKKHLLFICGLFSLTLGIVGIFVPVLPTTPFLLLAAGCFTQSSDKLYNWLITHKYFGKTIRNFREYRAIPLHTKMISLVLLWGTLVYSSLFVVKNIEIKLVLFAVAVGVSFHILHF